MFVEVAREGPGEDRGCLCAVGAGGLPAGSWCQSSPSVHTGQQQPQERLRVLRMVSSRVPAGLGLFLEPVTGLRVVISPEGKALVRACLVLSSTVESMWVPAAPSPTDM